MEHLPMWKTAWAANKQMFEMIFSKKGFFFFFLPIVVLNILTFIATMDVQFSMENASHEVTVSETMDAPEGSSYTDESYTSETIDVLEDQMHMPTDDKNLLLSILAIIFVNYFVALLAAVRWHRFMILQEDVAFSPFGLGKPMWKFLVKIVLITLFSMGVVTVLIGGTFLTFNALMDYMFIRIFVAVIVSIVVIYFVFKVVPQLYLVLPAMAVNMPLTFSQAYRYGKPSSIRLVFTTMLSGVLVILPLNLLLLLLSQAQSFTGETGMAYYCIISLSAIVSSLSIFPSIGVLSMFYMHYILPKLKEEAALEGDEEDDADDENDDEGDYDEGDDEDDGDEPEDEPKTDK